MAADIGSSKQLFIDDYIIAERYNVARALHQASKHEGNPILVADQPWELGDLGGYVESCFIHHDDDDQVYKMWYMEFPTSRPAAAADFAGKSEREVAEQAPTEERTNHCLAISRDLVHWEKPALGIVEYEGSTDNNLHEHHGCQIFFRDPSETDAAKRYKGIVRDEKRWCYVPEYSPDGLHWTIDYDHPMPHNIRDDAEQPYYDTQLLNDARYGQRVLEHQAGPDADKEMPITDDLMGKYVWPRRVWSKGTGGWGGKRLIGVSRSDDWSRWSPTEHMLFRPDAQDDERAHNLGAHHAEFYGFRPWPYQGIWVGFLHVFYVLVEDGAKAGGWPGLVEMQLVFSRDGYYWERAFDRTPIIPNGGPGEWDSGMVYRTAEPHIVDDEIWIHYNGFRDRHGPPYNWPGSRSSGVGLAKMRLDGFVSLEGCEQGGTVTTKPLRFAGSRLLVNADCADGFLAVELLVDGEPVAGRSREDCDTITTDDVRHTVTWRGDADVSALAGKEVQLRFVLRAGRLYSFAFQ